jgi:outer membrane protein OmpA-like peptidoglycan-associated protein
MFSSPKGSLSRILLVACAVGLGSSSLYGQDSSAPKPMAAPAAAPISKIDIFLGYSYLAPHGTIYTPLGDGSLSPNTYSSVDYGAIGSGAYYFNKYIGGQIEVGVHPDGNNDGATSYSAGLIARYPTDEGVTPFVHALAGAVRLGGPNYEPIAYHVYTWGPALTVGGGLDYGLPFFDHHLALRLFQADYEYWHASFGPQIISGGRANLNNARLSTGIVLKFGSIIPPPPVTYSCSASPSSIFPGDPITVTGTALNLNPKKTATYTWSGSGVKITGDSTTGSVDTTGLAPGSYTVTGHVSEGPKPGQFADCTANFTVKEYEPPTLTCSANPSTIKPGDTSTVTSVGVSPQNRPLTYSYSASAGTISGTGTTATLTTTGAPAGSITVTCNVADDKGHTATATTSVNIEAPPPPVVAKTETLCSIKFENDKKRPARVDNEAKACLDQVALSAQQKPDASVVVVGEASAEAAMPEKKHKGKKAMHEMSPAELAAQRAVNTKDYLVKEKGIDASRVSVRTGSQSENEVENYLVPAGATFDTDVPGTTAVDESTVKPQARTPLATKKPAHHKKAAAAAAPAQ